MEIDPTESRRDSAKKGNKKSDAPVDPQIPLKRQKDVPSDGNALERA
jgi:hypothetical protein